MVLIFSERLRAENSDVDANNNEDPHRRDDIDDDNEEAEPKSRVLAHVELTQTIREFGPSWQSQC